jgi:purine-binding chemotaxis protein CheW
MDLVVFRIGGQPYAMKIDFLEGIEAVKNVTPVANAPANIIGISNIRGEIVPILDVGSRFGLGYMNDKPEYLLVRINEDPICFMVDSVDGMKDFEPEELLSVPTIIVSGKTGYISNAIKYGEELILVILPNKIISDDEQQSISEFVSGMK